MFKNRPTSGWVYLPLCLTVVIFGLWRLSQLPFLAWLGIVTAIMGMVLPIVALVLSLNQNEKQTSRDRLQALALTSVMTGLSVVICWNSFQLFLSISSKNSRITKTVVVKNLSDQPIKDIRLEYAGQLVKIDKIPGYGKHELLIQVLTETTLKAALIDSHKTERSSQILIGPENSHVQVLVDLQQNIMAEVQ